jgi:hypothetical protein
MYALQSGSEKKPPATRLMNLVDQEKRSKKIILDNSIIDKAKGILLSLGISHC